MHGPDGAEFEMNNEFVEIVPEERIVIRHVQRGHDFRLTITFEEEDDATRLTWSMEFESAEEAQRVRDVVVTANEENLDRLEAQLATMS